MRKKIISILISLFLLTTSIVLTKGETLVFLEKHLRDTTQYLAPNLSINPTFYDFGDMIVGDTTFTTFEVWNSACCLLDYELIENCSWVTINPIRGTSSGEHDIITISVETNFLTPGYHQCDIHISSDGGEKDFYVYINTSIADAPKMTFFPRNYDFENEIKGTTPSTSFDLWNCGIGSLPLRMEHPQENMIQ